MFKSLHLKSALFLGVFSYVLIFVALIMQYVFGLEPCPLCIVQRLIFFCIGCALLVLFGVRMSAVIVAGKILLVFFSALGVLVASRHVWLQHLPVEELPGCIPSIGYMFETFEFIEALIGLYKGSADCGDVSWRFLGLSIPEQTLIIYFGYLFYSLWALTWRKQLECT